VIRFLVILFLIYVGLRALKALVNPGRRGRRDDDYGSEVRGSAADGKLPVTDEMLKDPHCGVYFPRKEGVPLNVDGETLYFCSIRCRDAYQQEDQG
jgi:YHS domain-containing protein